MQRLRLGSKGEEVRLLQEMLKDSGFPVGALDGEFGPGTDAALRAYQLSNGLVPDGVAGPRTMESFGVHVEAAPGDLGWLSSRLAARMFPHTPLRNIESNLPYVRSSLVGAGLGDRRMALMALATIRAETESFLPASEGVSRFNTSPGGKPFDLYDNRRDLGNRGAPDGALFRGRGYVQLTGRANYLRHGQAIGLGETLIEKPELAADPTVASRLLASFLLSQEKKIRTALAEGDLRYARRIVNGGSHGYDRFADAYALGDAAFPTDVN